MSITVNGHPVTSLYEAHLWTEANKPTAVAIDIEGTHYLPNGVTWDYPAPVTIHGTRAVFDGEGNVGTWWLGWNNPSNLSLINVTVRGFERGGVVITDGSVAVDRCRFTDLGSDACDGQRAGYAALYVSGKGHLSVTKTKFDNLVNNPQCTDDRYWAWMHAVYVVGKEGYGDVTACTFDHVSGDPVRTRNGAHVDVNDCRSVRSGERAVVSSWHAKTGEVPGTASVDRVTWDRGFQGQKITAWAGSPRR